MGFTLKKDGGYEHGGCMVHPKAMNQHSHIGTMVNSQNSSKIVSKKEKNI